MPDSNLIGLFAGTLTTVSFIPQVVRIWRRRHAEDISTGMFVIFIAGVALWLLYGIRVDAAPVIVANAVTLILASLVLVLKYHFRRRKTRQKD